MAVARDPRETAAFRAHRPGCVDGRTAIFPLIKEKAIPHAHANARQDRAARWSGRRWPWSKGAPRKSGSRLTRPWREADSNPRSRLSRGADLNREFATLGDLAGGVRRRATSSQFHRIAGGQLSGLFLPAPARQAYRHRVLRREPERA
jgi:hypothetical protein